MKILGIDPGLRCTGWGIINVIGPSLHYIDCGTINTDSKATMAKRLMTLGNSLKTIIKCHKPEICAIEETFLNKNPNSSLKLGHARGALILTAAQEGLPVHEYAATLIKKSITGVGRAEKAQMMMMVKTLLPKAELNSEDAADALATAICHSHHNKVIGAA